MQGKSVGSATPELEHVEAAKVLGELQDPRAGKSDGISPKSTHASRERKVYGTVLETYASCREEHCCPVCRLTPRNSNNKPPKSSTGDSVTVLRFVVIGSNSDGFTPNVERRARGTVVN